MQLKQYTDRELLGLLQAGDHHAFSELYRRYWDKLFYIAAKKLQENEEAESIVQDVFVDLWQRREQLNIETLEGYLVVAVKYRMINYLAKQDRAKHYRQHLAQQVSLTDSYTEEWISFEDLREWLKKMVSGLPEKCRMAYQLREEGYSQKEIAEHMQISEKTVETHITRALKTIRTSISQLFSFLVSLLL
ncbi:RNA polymerase sigma-70 factor (ECF subfamily) [Chitinophaga skermanii]|uniref:RNA polymerase sigma-70 factor (ECF subfamily) n=1 Tax=Chitinophaga skermanii TaxID=331697 RepID=A0A327QVB9_9BACT|nr:RNA polymerase sigma-70 factor [Chitinophaga skermanii]RAJ08261.1 RNA polymerase sigma-70 factor (ECF subfamily) [Chitinophaga skermanii]